MPFLNVFVFFVRKGEEKESPQEKRKERRRRGHEREKGGEPFFRLSEQKWGMM